MIPRGNFDHCVGAFLNWGKRCQGAKHSASAIGTKLRTVNGQKLKESQFVGALANVTSSSNRTSDHIESIGKSSVGRTKQGSQKQGGARSNGGSSFGKTAIREVPTGEDNQPM